ncbi:MAG: tRNA-queuosine alpha-mannosyltransferase domain-containing protein [Thermodesulfobacteriota bacterium]
MGPISTSRKNIIKAENDRNILVLEPYYGGSHKRFLKELSRYLPYNFSFLTLPARKWKWRMRFSAPWYAERLSQDKPAEAILCSTFIDVATFRSLAPSWVNRVPVFTYFHENQFAYPVQVKDERDFHFGLTNFTTALASDGIAFNSAYNLQTFLSGVDWIAKKVPDMKLDSVKELGSKAVILFPGLDFTGFPEIRQEKGHSAEEPVIVWNHRWEHDKDPETFFGTLYELSDQGFAFKLIVLGQSFQRQPSIFNEARRRLAEHIIHFGYLPERSEYLKMLTQGNLVVSTARHEFYGYSVIEAVRAGCRPLLPDRLSYPGLFPCQYLYKKGDLKRKLIEVMDQGGLDRSESCGLTDQFAWENLVTGYQAWFDSVRLRL